MTTPTTGVAAFEWIMAYQSGDDQNENILLDSGASVHTCPKSYRPEIPLERLSQSASLRTVTGQKIRIYGKKSVGYMFGTIRTKVTYYVADVRFPVISVSQLLRGGYTLHLGPEELYLAKDSNTCTVKRVGSLLYPRSTRCLPIQAVLAPTIGHKDAWQIRGNYLVRIHRIPRRALYRPTGTVDRPVELQDVSHTKVTIFHYLGESNKQECEDAWGCGERPTLLPRLWLGETRFPLTTAARKRLRGKQPGTECVSRGPTAGTPYSVPVALPLTGSQAEQPIGPAIPAAIREIGPPPGLQVQADRWESAALRGFGTMSLRALPCLCLRCCPVDLILLHSHPSASLQC